MAVPITFCFNSSYDDMVTSIMENKNLSRDLIDLAISYLMNVRRKIYLKFIKNDRHVGFYMFVIATIVPNLF